MSPSDNLAIVVPAYNRAASLERLLHSLRSLETAGCKRVTLVISIDASDNTEVPALAERFEWGLGEKRVIRHSKNLGLRRHILACGDLTEEFSAVILLEDDLFVSPATLHWVRAALTAFHGDTRIAGISLYHYAYNEFARLPFTPLADGYDNYFCQVPSSWGQVWTRAQWRAFREFYAANPLLPPDAALPEVVQQWPESSWKKHAMHYLAATDRWFVFPRVSYSTNFGDTGTHYVEVSHVHQVPLQYGAPPLRLAQLEDSLARYDAHFDPLPATLRRLNPSLARYDFDTDFYGTKPPAQASRPYRISIRPHSDALGTFGLRMRPVEANVIHDIGGDLLTLGHASAFGELTLGQRARVLRALLNCDVSLLEAETARRVRGTRSYRLGKALLHPLAAMR